MAFRKLLGDVKQWKGRQELALELLPEIHRPGYIPDWQSRSRRNPTVKREGYISNGYVFAESVNESRNRVVPRKI